MTQVPVSTDIIFEHKEQCAKFRLGKIEGSAVFEVYMNNKLIYYTPLKEDDCKIDSDIELITILVDEMRKKEKRWLDIQLCTWLTIHFKEMSYRERITAYNFSFRDIDSVMQVFVTEDKDKHAKLHILNDEGLGKLSIDFDIQAGSNILAMADKYVQVLVKIVSVFKSNMSEIERATLVKNMFIE